ncbi:MAG: 50S ribosomal protein L21 [Candidatus Liptonbacteria bacterium]|nr:50S ribosomal protein L21 [Candidatus Liptonbacteria bacterium]
MYAVIESGGKQYRVREGQKIKIDKINVREGDGVPFNKVLLRVSDSEVEIGAPYLARVVEGKVVRQGRARKQMVFRYHSKTRYRKKKGHRQSFTEVEVVKV